MGLVFESTPLDVYLTVGILFVCFYFYLTQSFSYWKKRGVPYIKPMPILGNIKDMVFQKYGVGEFLKNIYDLSKGKPYVGIFAFHRPVLVARDLEIIKNILIKDSNIFLDRSFAPDETLDPLSYKSLFGQKGQKWRHLRIKLSPTFTSGKMKTMFQLVDICGKELAQSIDKHDGKSVPMKDVTSKFTMDTIASCAFGIDANSQKSANSEFQQMMKAVFHLDTKKFFKFSAAFFIPSALKMLKIKVFDQEVEDFVRQTFWDVVQHREKNKVSRGDFVQLLIQLKEKGYIEEETAGTHTNGDVQTEKKWSSNGNTEPEFKFGGDDFVGQAFSFLVAGYETSSTVLTFCLYELALHLEIQKKVKEEINSVLNKHGGNLSYDIIAEMTYLDMVISETLRKYPPLPFLDRVCLKNYELPGTDLHLEKGTTIFIPMLGIHYDPKYYPNPEKFDPERFSKEEKQKRPTDAFFPFGAGPRFCIGMRFGMMQVKVGIIHVLSRFEAHLCKETEIPPAISPRSVTITTLNEIPLIFKKTL